METNRTSLAIKRSDRIRLISMTDDPNPIAAGTTGTVFGIYPHGDWTQVDVDWDSGRSLMLTIPPDVIERIGPAKNSPSC